MTPLDDGVVGKGAAAVDMSTEIDEMLLVKLTILVLYFQIDIRNGIAQLTNCFEDLTCCK